ncbi:conserved hypothetical protein, partial [Ricinus communis]
MIIRERSSRLAAPVLAIWMKAVNSVRISLCPAGRRRRRLPSRECPSTRPAARRSRPGRGSGSAAGRRRPAAWPGTCRAWWPGQRRRSGSRRRSARSAAVGGALHHGVDRAAVVLSSAASP